MEKDNNLYARLGIPLDANPEEIRRAYREAARHLHPDTNDDPAANEMFLKIQEAYSILGDPARKASYDGTLPRDIYIPPAVTISTTYSRPYLQRILEPQLLYVLLDMKSQIDTDVNFSPPLNVVLVLDCSTSMQGQSLDIVKATALELLHQLKPEDLFSLVAFNDRADVIVSARSQVDRQKAETSIRMLQAQGGTEIFKGLEAGYKEAVQSRRKDYINHVILITDGHTYGDEARCTQLAETASQEGIGISCLGLGNKWNDGFLDDLASRTGGSSMYVSRAKDIKQYLKNKFSNLDKSYADRTTFNFETGPEVQLRYAFRMEPDASCLETGPRVHFGSVPRRDSLMVLLEFLIASVPSNAQHITLAEGHITLQIPTRPVPTFIMRLKLELNTANDGDVSPPPLPIMQAMSRLTLYRMQEMAQKDIEAGDILHATRRLQTLATHLLAKGEHELARTVLNEASNIERNHKFSEEGQKEIKYGTRSLLLPSSHVSFKNRSEGAH